MRWLHRVHNPQQHRNSSFPKHRNMEVRNNVLGFLLFTWVAGLAIALSVGLGLRFGVYGWRRHYFPPGDEVVLFTGANEGVFCETVEIQSSGYITAQNILIRDWDSFEKPEIQVDHFDIPLSDRYYDFRKYRLYAKDWLDISLCSEFGLIMHVASSLEAFTRLKSDIEKGYPCTENPSVSDPFCGKAVATYKIKNSESCEWSPQGGTRNWWQRARFVAEISADVFIVLRSDPLQNRKKNLLEVANMGKTFKSVAADVVSECIQQQMCMFAFDFSYPQAVVVQVGTANDDPTQAVEMWTYCQARDWFFVLIFCLCPLVVLSAVTFCVVRRFTPRHNLAYV